jgi:signal transduction histidine kinase
MTSPLTAEQRDALGERPGPTLLRLAAQERALSRATLQIFAQRDEEALLRLMPDVVSALLQVDLVALFLTSDDDAPAPRCRLVWRQGSVRLLPPEEAPVDAFAAEVLRRQAPRQVRSWSPPEGDPCDSALAVPLSAQGSALGVLIVGRSAPERFRDDHVCLLSVIGQYLALALLRMRATLPPDGSRERELERLKTEFVSVASHEIRTPLAALQGFTEIMLSREVPPNVQRDWLSLMNQEAVRLAGLLEELVSLTRVESGQLALKLAPVHLSDVVCRVVRLLDSEGRRAHLLLEEVPEVTVDGDKLAQVVTNLLRNALDYSPEEQPVEVEVARRCLARESGSLVVVNGAARIGTSHDCQPAVSVAVRDRGIGMTAEELHRTFQPFYRTEASRELLPEGSGLGLAITKAIVDRHQGCLWAHSRPGKGSIYGFCLPQNDGAT